jgi:hypothetical protein
MSHLPKPRRTGGHHKGNEIGCNADREKQPSGQIG